MATMISRLKSAFVTIFSAFIILSSYHISCSQTINRYLFLHQNGKNDSQIRRSPLSSGYDKGKYYEFNYEPVPGEVMREKAKIVIPDNENINDEEKEDIEKILGGYNFDFSYEEESTFLKELDAEAEQAILKQQLEKERASIEKQKSNIASYTARVEAKKLREKEALERAKNPPEEKDPRTTMPDYFYEDDKKEDEDSESFELISDKDGKIRIKKPSNKENASDTSKI